MRVEAEHFRHLEGFVVEDRNDHQASHRLNVRLNGASAGRIRPRFDEPFVAVGTNRAFEARYFDERGQRCRFAVFVNGVPRGAVWGSADERNGGTSHPLCGVAIRIGDEIRVNAEGAWARLDYFQPSRGAP